MLRALTPALVVALALSVVGVARPAVIVGTPGPDRLSGTLRADELYGLGGTDRIEGRGANDLIDAGPGRDRVLGGAGADRIAANDGFADRISCNTARDIVTADRQDRVDPDCETVSRQLSRDGGADFLAQHQTQVEPDSAAWGSTIVTVFQSGRFADGGAEAIGFSTSRNGGRSWKSARLSGGFERVSDPVVAYDAAHRWWIATVLASEESIAVYRSRDGLTWRPPVIVEGDGQEYDKEWITCDTWAASRFRGRCYLTYMNFSTDTIETRRSTNGGLTWSAPVTVDASRPPAIVNGPQIAIRPNGHALLIFSVWGSPLGGNEIAVARSGDGGLSFSAPARAVVLDAGELSWLRAPPFASVDVDAGGTVHVAWRNCDFSPQCSGEIDVIRSSDGVGWTAPQRLPTGPDDGSVFYFLPALAVDATTAGATARLALLYHSMAPSRTCDPSYGCFEVDVSLTTSSNGGSTWTPPRRLNAFPMLPAWMADTSLGRMLGDYVALSWVRSRPVPVFSLAAVPAGDSLRQAIVATTRVG
jgi:RTX calcium-binding nonapeptide repeat (4 copies)